MKYACRIEFLDKAPAPIDLSLMENSVDYVTVFPNSPDREFGTRSKSINQILCNSVFLDIAKIHRSRAFPKVNSIPALYVTVKYGLVTTREEVLEEKRIAQDYFFHKYHKRISLGEITLNYKEGDEREVVTGFRVVIGDRLYTGLHLLSIRAPEVFSQLVSDMRNFAEINSKDDVKSSLGLHAVSELEKISSEERR